MIKKAVAYEDKRPERPTDSECVGDPISDDFWHVIQCCWRTKPEERWTMQEVVDYFHQLS
jgi:hypothetical protein